MSDRTHSPTGGLVVNFSELEREQVRAGVSRCAVGTSDVMLVMNYIEPDMEPSPHSHADFDQIAVIVSGRAIYNVSGVGHAVGPGSVLIIPAGEEHWIQPLGDERVENLDVFAPPRSDYAHLIEWMLGATR